MANAIIGALRVSLGLDSAEFSKGLSGAQNKLSGFDKRMRSLGGKIAAVGAGISVAGAGIALAIRGQVDAADEMSKAAQKFGVPIETLSKLKYAADLSDVSLETLGKSFGILSKGMVAAAGGNKAAAEKFAAIGVAVEDATGKLRPSEAVMSDIADVLAKMPDGAEKTALAMSLFGKSGAELIPLLNGGGASMREMMAEAEALGLTISEKTGKDAEAFNDNVTRLQMALRGLAIEITAALLPVMVALSKKAVELAKWFGDLSPRTQKIVAILAGITVVLGPLLIGLGAVTAAIGALAGAFAALAAAALANPFVALIAAIAAGAALIYLNWDGISAYFSDLWAKVAKAGQDAWNTVLTSWASASDYFVQFFTDLGTTFSNGWAQILDIASQWVTDFLKIGGDIIDGLKAGITAKWDAMVSWFSDKADALAQSIRDAFGIQSPSRVFRDIGQYLTEGLSLGVSDNVPMVQDAMAGVGDAISGSSGSLKSGLDGFRSSAESVFTGLVTGALSFNEALGQVLDSLAQMLAKSAFGSLFGDGSPSGGSGILGSLLGFANGTPSAPGGLTMVGERGPELVNMPRGAQVFSAPETRAMLGGSQGLQLHFAIDARYATEGTAEMIARTLQAKTPEIISRAVASVGAAKRRGVGV